MSKSMPVEWHRQCLVNMQNGLAYKESELARVKAEVEALRASSDLRLRQITEAERRGKTEFDAHRYLVKRAKKDAAE